MALFWAIFLSSGAFGLMYEILWVRFFSQVLGSTVYAASAVTAAYMGGLAIGAWMPGSLSDRVRSPLHWYASFELLIGAYAVAFLHAGPALAGAMYQASGTVYAKFAIAMAALAVPTILMGATLPFVSVAYLRIFEPSDREFSISLLYGINAAGGVAGIVLATFYLIGSHGVTATTFIAAAGNAAVALAALYIAGGAAISGGGTPAAERAPDASTAQQAPPRWAAFAAFFVTGFCALALEIVWTRLLILVIGTSIYAFSIILVAYICGIPAGSILLPLLLRRRPGLQTFGVVLMMLGIASALTMPMISAAPFAFVSIYNAYHAEFGYFLLLQYALCLMVMIIPATLSGYAFTCALGSIRAGGGGTPGADVGRLYFMNTLGSVLGAIAAPFAFIKYLGLQNSVITLSAAFMLAGIALTALAPGGKRIRAARAALCVIAYALVLATGGGIDMEIVASGVHYHPEKLAEMPGMAEMVRFIKTNRLLFMAEGVDSTVGIYTKNDVTYLKINGKIDASTGWYDMNTQLMLGHLPMALARTPDRVAVIGLGAGVTAGAVMRYKPAHVDCLEINPNVIDAARFFTKVSGLDFSAPNLSILEEDALSYFANTKSVYDVIISEPSNPWMAGVASLFTVDHFRNCRARLAPQGLICQWLHLYSMSKEDFIRILVTFHKVFPNATLWFSSWGDALIIATNGDFTPDFNAVRARISRDGVREQLALIEIFSLEAFLAHQILDAETLSAIASGSADARVNSHDTPYLEFSAPANYYRQDHDQITKALMERHLPDRMLLSSYVKGDRTEDISHETLARAYYKLKQFARADEHFKLATEKNPALWFIHLKKAENLYAEKMMYEALNEIQIAIYLAPDRKECYAALLKVAREMGDYFTIVRVFLDAEKHFTGVDRYEYHLALATGYEGCGETYKAIMHYRKVIELSPDNFVAHKELGLIYQKTNDVRAEEFLKAAYKLRKDDREVIEALSKLQGGK